MSLSKFIWCNRSTLWKNIPILEINYLKELTEILLYIISLFSMIWTSGRAILSEDCPSVVLLAPSLAVGSFLSRYLRKNVLYNIAN